jgi:methyl-accepting chemotaxis protein
MDRTDRKVIRRVINNVIEHVENSIGNLEGCIESTEQEIDNAVELLEQYKNMPQFAEIVKELDKINDEIEGIEELSAQLSDISNRLRHLFYELLGGNS